MKMKNNILTCALALCALTGCIDKKIVWSPNGEEAAVIAEGGLYLCDSNGALSALLVPDVRMAAWFPDSKRLVVSRSVECMNWADLAPLLPPERRDRIVAAATNGLAQIRLGKTPEQALDGLTESDAGALCLYVRTVAGAREALGTNWTEVETNQAALDVVQVGAVSGGKIELGPPLARELDNVNELRVSPDGRAIAYVIDTTDNAFGRVLKVTFADKPDSTTVVDSQVAKFPDWSPDGQSLVYIRAVGIVTNKEQLRLASLTRRGVAARNGAFKIQDKPDELAGLVFQEDAKTRCLSDGRILFSGADVRLPCAASGMPTRQQLFSISPGAEAAVKPLVPAQNLESIPQDTSFFEVNPGETRVSLVGKKAVVIVDLANGAVEKAPAPAEDPTTVPVWRTANELCYVTLPAGGGAAQLALWRDGHARVISGTWPEDVRKGMLDK